jgi:DNA-binding NtrC family response regulator
MIEHNTILYLFDADSSNRVLAVLEENGYKVVSTNSPAEAVALFYVTPSVAAVVLDERAREEARFDVAHSLREIHPNVPVVLLCGDQIENLPAWAEKCVSTDKVIRALHALLNTEAVVRCTRI